MPNTFTQTVQRRGQPLVLLVSTLAMLLLTSLPVSVPALEDLQHNILINSAEYKREKGHWDIVNLPKEFRLNTIHAALLPTGKVLLVAGSGNNPDNFSAYNDNGMIEVLKTVIYNPSNNSVKSVKTPSDLFCGGHAELQSGNLLVAGGTSGYEILAGRVKVPAGGVTIHIQHPNFKQRILKKGTVFVSPAGKKYRSTADVTLYPATKMDHGNGNVMIMDSTTTVFVEAEQADDSYLAAKKQRFTIEGLNTQDAKYLTVQADPMTRNKQDYRGDSESYEFDPYKEEYVRVGGMHVARWYPTLATLMNGDVMAVSGLDNVGKITNTSEMYDPKTKAWTLGPNRLFSTYPALFRTKDPNVLFYSGSNAGYAPDDQGRTPGFWNIKTNKFTPVTGLRQANILETSGSVMLPPAKGSNNGQQSWRVMVAGGGGIGESPLVTARTDIIDMSAKNPHYTPGPDLLKNVRYPNMVVTPWDEVFVSGGATDYRAKNDSFSYLAYSINPTTNQVTRLADELVGRDYHSGGLLLPDGRILMFGGDELGAEDPGSGVKFEQRLEIYTPPQLYAGPRPELHGAHNQKVKRGQKLSFTSDQASDIKTARLIPPSSTTHVTNIEQRSVAAIVSAKGNNVTIKLPKQKNVMPNGWYMLFVTNSDGTPSHAIMVQVVT